MAVSESEVCVRHQSIQCVRIKLHYRLIKLLLLNSLCIPNFPPPIATDETVRYCSLAALHVMKESCSEFEALLTPCTPLDIAILLHLPF